MAVKIVIVDEQDQVVGVEDFHKTHREGIRHRSSVVFIFRDASLKETLLFRRSSKVQDPLTICSVGGHVDEGGSYLSTARKELEEEAFHRLSAPNLELKNIGKLSVDRPENSEFTATYLAVHPGPFQGNDEVDEILGFRSLEWIEKDMREHPEKYAPDFITQFRFLRSRL